MSATLCTAFCTACTRAEESADVDLLMRHPCRCTCRCTCTCTCAYRGGPSHASSSNTGVHAHLDARAFTRCIHSVHSLGAFRCRSVRPRTFVTSSRTPLRQRRQDRCVHPAPSPNLNLNLNLNPATSEEAGPVRSPRTRMSGSCQVQVIRPDLIWLGPTWLGPT